MAAFYVYAPYTGTFNSRWNDACTYGSDYCPTPCHPAAWGTRPADIGAGAGQEISFWTSPTIGSSTYPVLSIVVSSLSGGVCLNTSIPLPWDGGMKVEMRSGFNGAGALLGTVYFAHVQNVASGAFNTINGGVTYIGYVPSSCPTCPGYCTNCSDCSTCECYRGHHIHIERSGNSVHNSSISCGDTMIEGASWIYKYTC